MRSFVALSLALIACAACSERSGGSRRRDAIDSEVKEFAAIFQNYLDAVSARNGAAAVALVGGTTSASYERLRWMSLHASRAQLEAAPILDRVRVLGIRATFDADRLAGMTGEMLFAASIDAGLTDVESMAGSRITDVWIDGDRASGVYVSATHGRGPRFGFTRENGVWKLDLESMMKTAEILYAAMIQRTARDLDVSESRLLEVMVAESVGRELYDSAWEPLLVSPAASSGGPR